MKKQALLFRTPNIFLVTCICILFVLLSGCNPTSGEADENSTNSEVVQDEPEVSMQASDSPFESVTWIDLIPENDLEILMNPPEYVMELEDGSEEDIIDGQLANTMPIDENDPYQQALTSTKVIDEMDDKDIRIPGFVVPLTFSEDQLVTQFFLVPYFGACIHEPPPPPNQIILVNSPKGIEQEALYQPYWISGRLKTEIIENEMAKAAYVMHLAEYELYTEANAMPEAEFE